MDEKPKRSKSSSPRDNTPCPICGDTHYEWGHPGSSGGVYFLPEGASFGFGAGQSLEARKCLRCGNVQIFIKQR
jgi:hypothetical protein